MKPSPTLGNLSENDMDDRVSAFADLIEIPPDAPRPVDLATFRKALGWILATEVAMESRSRKKRWSLGEIEAVAIIEAAGPCCTYEQYHDYAARFASLLGLLWGEPRFGEYFDPEAESWEDVADLEMLRYFVRYPFEPVGFGGVLASEFRSFSAFRHVAVGDLDLLADGKRTYLLFQELMDAVEHVLGKPLPEGRPIGAELPKIPTGTPWLDGAIEHLTLLRTVDVLTRSLDELRRNVGTNPAVASARLARVRGYSIDVDECLRKVLAAVDSPTPPPDLELPRLEYFATIRKIRRSRPALTKEYRRRVGRWIRRAAEGRPIPIASRESLKKPSARGRLPARLGRARPVNVLGLRHFHQFLRDEEDVEGDVRKVLGEFGLPKGKERDIRHRLEILGHALSDPRSQAWLTPEGEPTMPLFYAAADLNFDGARRVAELNDFLYAFLDNLMASEEPRIELARRILEVLQELEYLHLNEEQTVAVGLTGSLKATRLKISSEIIDPARPERVEEAVRTTFVEAVRMVEKDLADVRAQFARREPVR
jgi:DNA-binding protein YbaB